MAGAFTTIDTDVRKKTEFASGDTVRVWSKIKDKDKYRLQAFEGLVLARKHGTSPSATFTVRKVTSGVGVERIFPLYSPTIDKIEVTKKAKTRRSKLYYIRDKAAKEVRRKMKAIVQGKITAEEVPVEPEMATEEAKTE
ncbi:MAG TPA: 50S ribosomal protein L19 [Candidatus Paceibacterota bacterium]|nr:50S ribosomal protein L19 [Candidatus Paceibacterota bacterium]